MQAILFILIKTYLRILGRVAPRLAGRQGFALFCTPRFRAPVPGPGQEILARGETLDLEVDGERVVGYRWRNPDRQESGGEAPLVILVHGWESRAGRLTQWVEPLLEAGFQVAAFDAPGHGASEGKRSNPMKFARSLAALADRIGQPVHGLVGHSVGGLSSILALGGGELLGRPNLEVERLVVIAGAESGVDATAMFCQVLGLSDAFHQRMLDSVEGMVGLPMSALDAHRLFPHQPVPTLWFHDPEDPEVPYEGARKVAATSPQVHLEETPGLGHHHIARDPELIRRGVAFLVEGAVQTAAVA